MSYNIVTAKQMQNIDQTTIEKFGVTGIELMENAGEEIAEILLHEYEPEEVGIVTGKGNNAGDGLVVARLLANEGVNVKLIMTTQGENLSASGQENFKKLPKKVEVYDRLKVPEMPELFNDCDVVLDALLGTGIEGAPRGVIGEAISVMNDLPIPIVAVDIPSGLNTDTGEAEGACVIAQTTVTMGLPKRGMFLGVGPDVCGEIEIVDIGFPEELMEDPECKDHLIGVSDVLKALPPRPKWGHKGTFGTLLVIAGSLGYEGAAWLTTGAGLRSGVGLVFGAYPAKVADLVSADLVEAIKVRLNGHDGEYLTHDCWKGIEPHFDQASAVALGPGIGMHEETRRLVDELVCVRLPMVIDADGLNCLGEKVQYLTERDVPTVLTPHPGEMARLTGKNVEEIEDDRFGSARKLAQETEAVVVLKGAHTVVASPQGDVYVNRTGNSGMAKGGSGDVLTGLIGGFLAQGLDALEASCAGVFLHGLAGDTVSEHLGERGMTARDILQALPGVMKFIDDLY